MKPIHPTPLPIRQYGVQALGEWIQRALNDETLEDYQMNAIMNLAAIAQEWVVIKE